MDLNERFFLACDLDRTLLPDGPEPISVNALKVFSDSVSRGNVTLVYLSGRSLEETLSAIGQYGVPLPNMIVGDVGTSIYIRKDDKYEVFREWYELIKSKWKVPDNSEISNLLYDLPYLELQEPQHQNIFKISYYTPLYINKEEVTKQILNKLSVLKIDVKIIISEDKPGHKCFLDILPASASKIDGLRFLVNNFGIKNENVVYSGDSGNDLEPLTSGYNAIVVKNADENFKKEVSKLAAEKRILDKVYFAKGGYLGMNGNYIGGILEGLNYFGFI